VAIPFKMIGLSALMLATAPATAVAQDNAAPKEGIRYAQILRAPGPSWPRCMRNRARKLNFAKRRCRWWLWSAAIPRTLSISYRKIAPSRGTSSSTKSSPRARISRRTTPCLTGVVRKTARPRARRRTGHANGSAGTLTALNRHGRSTIAADRPYPISAQETLAFAAR
jgi:hypothetical protein